MFFTIKEYYSFELLRDLNDRSIIDDIFDFNISTEMLIKNNIDTIYKIYRENSNYVLQRRKRIIQIKLIGVVCLS